MKQTDDFLVQQKQHKPSSQKELSFCLCKDRCLPLVFLLSAQFFPQKFTNAETIATNIRPFALALECKVKILLV